MRFKPATVAAVVFSSGISLCATTYWVAPDGNDSYTSEQAQNEATPKRTIAAALALIPLTEGGGAGHTIIVKAGTYAESFNAYDNTSLRGGSSWSAPFTIKAKPGDNVVIKPNAGADRVVIMARTLNHHVIIDGFVLDGVNTTYDVVKITYMGNDPANTAHHIRIQNCEIMNGGQGILGSGNYSEFLNLKIHDNGRSDFDHGIYFSGNNNLIEGCEFYRNAGWGIHKYPKGDNNIIRNNRLHDNARLGKRGPGVALYGGTGNQVYNNLIWNNREGIALDYGESNAKIYNNTISGNSAEGIYNGSGSSFATFKNNLLYQNGGGFADAGPGTIKSNNLIDVDPKFASATAKDFHLLSGSPAIDTGANLATEGVTKDFAGTARPQGGIWDCGAYEYIASSAISNRRAVLSFGGLTAKSNRSGNAIVYTLSGRRISDLKGMSARSAASGLYLVQSRFGNVSQEYRISVKK